jgi:Type IV secretory pathway, TrbL components
MTDVDSVTQTFLNYFVAAESSIASLALGLCASLMVIQMVLNHVLNMDDDHIQILIRESIQFGFWLACVKNYTSWEAALLDGFISVATTAGAPSSISAQALIQKGVEIMIAVNPLKYSDNAVVQLFTALSAVGFFDTVIFLLVGLSILVAFMLMAWEVCITTLEYHLIAAMAVIFLPFGVLNKAASLAEGAIHALIHVGVKMMTLYFILGIGLQVIQSYTLSGQPKLDVCLYVMGSAWMIALLTWHAPGLAASLMGRGPSMSASSTAGAGATAVGAGVLAVRGGGAILRGAKKLLRGR